MGIPYRLKKLADAAQNLIKAASAYKTDYEMSITAIDVAKDFSDVVTLALMDGGFSEKEQKEIAKLLIRDIFDKYRFREEPDDDL